MITDAILSFLSAIPVGLINLLPTFSVPTNVLGAFAEAVSWVRVIGFYIPIDTAVTCLFAYIAAWITSIIISTLLKLL